jgi:ligand-binding SRPBCC domain-containing protein
MGAMRKISLTSVYAAPPETVWRLVQRPDTLTFVARPILTFRPRGRPFPEVWAEGDYEVSMFFLGVIPLGRQTVGVRFEDRGDGAQRLRDAGHGQLAKTWDHLITVEHVPEGTRYTDEVSIDAGWLTAPVALFARLFYAHRQRRWRTLLARTRDQRPAA